MGTQLAMPVLPCCSHEEEDHFSDAAHLLHVGLDFLCQSGSLQASRVGVYQALERIGCQGTRPAQWPGCSKSYAWQEKRMYMWL